MIRASLLAFAVTIVLVLLPLRYSNAQPRGISSGERLVVCVIQLAHADADDLASVLKPFLSPQGSIVSYQPTNSLIIKDRAPIVDQLAEIIKGQPCTAAAEQRGIEAGRQQEEFYLDR